MARTRLPRDDNNHAIPVLRFRTGSAQNFSTNASNAVSSASIAEGTRVVTLICSVNSYFESMRRNSASHKIKVSNMKSIKIQNCSN
jgi:hypothetical protein